MFKKAIFYLGVFVLLVINIFSAIFGKDIQFFTIGLVNFILGLYLLKINPIGKIGYLLIFFYFILINSSLIYAAFTKFDGYNGFLIVLIYNLSTIFCVTVFKSKGKRLPTIIYLALYLSLCVFYYNIENRVNDYRYNTGKTNKLLPKIEIYDLKNNEFTIEGNGKVQVIDFWSNSCGYCIQSFPKFESLKKHYENDNEVQIYSVNVDEKKPNRVRGNGYVKDYTFLNYFAKQDILKILNIESFPYYMIIGKDGKIKYFGNLYIGNLETYNNIYKLIDNEK